jgi:hypothetical protein
LQDFKLFLLNYIYNFLSFGIYCIVGIELVWTEKNRKIKEIFPNKKKKKKKLFFIEISPRVATGQCNIDEEEKKIKTEFP